MKISTNIYDQLFQIIERAIRIPNVQYEPNPDKCDVYIWDGNLSNIDLLLKYAKAGKIIITKQNKLFEGSPFYFYANDKDVKDIIANIWIGGVEEMKTNNEIIENKIIKKKRHKFQSDKTIAICTGAWGRFPLLELFCKYYKELKEIYPIELYVSVSEPKAKEIVERYGHKAIEINNTPLYAKMNAAVISASVNNPDYCIMIGSDDFLSHELIEYYFELFEKKYDYIYTLDWYFFDIKTKKGMYWGGYLKTHNRGIACGAGRCLSRNILKKMKWMPWIPGYDRGLDTGMDEQMKNIKYTSYGFYLKEKNVFAVDVKSSTNMTPFARWENTVELDGKTMLFNGMDNYEEIYKCAEYL